MWPHQRVCLCLTVQVHKHVFNRVAHICKQEYMYTIRVFTVLGSSLDCIMDNTWDLTTLPCFGTSIYTLYLARNACFSTPEIRTPHKSGHFLLPHICLSVSMWTSPIRRHSMTSYTSVVPLHTVTSDVSPSACICRHTIHH